MHTVDHFIFESWKVSLPLTGLCRMTGSLPLSKKKKKLSSPLSSPGLLLTVVGTVNVILAAVTL